MRQCNNVVRRNSKTGFRRAGGKIVSLFVASTLLWLLTAAHPQFGAAQQDRQAPGANLGGQSPVPPPAPPKNSAKNEFRLKVEADLVVLNATVLDKNSRPVTDLAQSDFRVFENGMEQKLKVFKREDIPVSVGIMVDNSGSMRDKRRGVNAAALKFVRTSNPLDEVFIVNFNDEAFLDADFTDNIKLLEEGLEKIDSRGGTALYDALEMSLKYLVDKGTRDKKVLLVVTDGEDNASRASLEQVVKQVQRSDVMIYTVGLLADEGGSSLRRAKRALEAFSKASGGSAFFPKNPSEVDSIATNISNDIRNQFVLAYTPTNAAHDGTFRKVEVKVNSRKYGKLMVRTRTGYYAKEHPAG
ncbi:MAG: VWA domain-containing protein [Acidobacteria bacterium]|nr:VWA domain-containing protein [Acidobacteriota bacterium]